MSPLLLEQESLQKANSLDEPSSAHREGEELSRSAPNSGPGRPPPARPPPSQPSPQQPSQAQQKQQQRPRGDTGHISFGGIVHSPSVATVAANIEAVGPAPGARFPDLMRVGHHPPTTHYPDPQPSFVYHPGSCHWRKWCLSNLGTSSPINALCLLNTTVMAVGASG